MADKLVKKAAENKTEKDKKGTNDNNIISNVPQDYQNSNVAVSEKQNNNNDVITNTHSNSRRIHRMQP